MCLSGAVLRVTVPRGEFLQIDVKFRELLFIQIPERKVLETGVMRNL